ncbi:MAG: hypothetical protein ABWY25_03560 [Paenisporosarcina sp.]
MTDYQGNSDKSKKLQSKNVEKVIVGEVIQRPKPIGRKFKDIFFGGDAKATVRYVTADVLLPALRNLIVDMTTEGVRRVVYGESSSRRNRTIDFRSRVQYNNPINPVYRDPRERTYLPDQPPYPFRATTKRDLNEYIVSTKAEAERVVELLVELVDQYGVATVADFYDMLGLTSSHIDNKWGWTHLGKIEISQVREGYLISLPPLEAV